MKRKLLLLGGVLLTSLLGANAQTSPYTGSEVQAGDFFIYNVETGLWLQNNEKNKDDWNTRGATGTYGFDFAISAVDDGNGYSGWKLDPKFGHNHSMNASNFYLDTGDGVSIWTLEPKTVDGVSNAYTIRAGENVLGLDDSDNMAFNTNQKNTWQLVTRAERIAYLEANATEDNPLDATFLIQDPGFANENERRNSWTTFTRDGGNQDETRWFRNRRSYAFWNSKNVEVSQTISNVPNGVYKLQVKGYYRDGNKDDVANRRAAGTERLLAKYFINNDEEPMMSILDGANPTWVESIFYYPAADAEAPYGHYPDNADAFNRAFQDYPNNYMNAGVTSTVTGKSIYMGLKKTEANANDWVAFDEFRLTYMGPVNDVSAFIDALNVVIAEAEALNTDNTSDKVKDAFDAALAEAKSKLSSTSSEEISEAQANLQAAIDLVKAVDVSVLRQTAALAESEGLDVTAANNAIANAMTADELSAPLYDLRAARKINALRMPDIYTGSAPAAGKVYFYNLGTGMFLGTGSDWNTHAAVDQVGIEIELIADGDNFKMKTNRGGGWLNWGAYVDTGNQDVWHFVPVAGKENVYNISSSGNDGNLLGYDPNGPTDGKKYWSTVAKDRTGVDNPMNQWKIITPAEREALISSANVDKPVDVSYLIKNASLNRQDGYDMWSKECVEGNGGARVSTINNNNGDRAADYAYEYFNPNSFSFTQQLEGLAPGNYEVSVQAFFRNGDGGAQVESYNNGEPAVRLAYLLANDEKQLLPNITSELNKAPGVGDLATCNDGDFPNMPQSAIEFFEVGCYKTTLAVTVGTDGKLKIGVAKDEKQKDGDWVVLDNFRLTYLGPVEIETMSIVGDFSANGWDATQGIAMTMDDENPAIWTAVVEDFTVTSDKYNYEYKAVANGNWTDYVLPAGDNQKYDFDYDGAREGKYTLTFTANTSTKTVELSVRKHNENTYTVAGSEALFGSEWDPADTDNDMTENEDGTFSITYTNVALTGNVEYKVVENHAWTNSWPSENRVIGISMAGNYDVTINFDPATGSVSETMAIYKGITDAGYATYCSPYDINFEGSGITAYIAKQDVTTVSFEEVESAPANTGLLLKANEGTYRLSMEVSSADVTGNVLVGTLKSKPVDAGSFVLMNGDKGVGFYKTKNEFTVGANTAYLPAEASARSFIGFEDDSQTTGVEYVTTESQQPTVIYNMSGQRVTTPRHGLYIVRSAGGRLQGKNGKKIVK